MLLLEDKIQPCAGLLGTNQQDSETHLHNLWLLIWFLKKKLQRKDGRKGEIFVALTCVEQCWCSHSYSWWESGYPTPVPLGTEHRPCPYHAGCLAGHRRCRNPVLSICPWIQPWLRKWYDSFHVQQLHAVVPANYYYSSLLTIFGCSHCSLEGMKSSVVELQSPAGCCWRLLEIQSSCY